MENCCYFFCTFKNVEFLYALKNVRAELQARTGSVAICDTKFRNNKHNQNIKQKKKNVHKLFKPAGMQGGFRNTPVCPFHTVGRGEGV